MHTSRTLSVSRTRFVPRVETLDGRVLPAGVTTNGTTVIIEAGGRSNAIAIVDSGTGQVGNLSVTVDGKTEVPPVAAAAVRIRTGGGADSVSYRLAGPMTGTTMDITTNLGPGDNRFRATIAAGLQAGAKLELSTRGGDGTT